MYLKLEDFLSVMGKRYPGEARWVLENYRKIEYGLLPVGLKIHFLDLWEFLSLTALTADLKSGAYLENNFYKRRDAPTCLVLPPVGSATCAIKLLELIQKFLGVEIFDNPRIQIQVCTAGRLENRRAGLLTLAFYLGSDSIRVYNSKDLESTFSACEYIPRGCRITIYDGRGELDRKFPLWNSRRGKFFIGRRFVIDDILPFQLQRTDVVSATSRIDIQNINLVASLLCHAKWGWYWRDLGTLFAEKMEKLLQKHQLYLDGASWVHDEEGKEDVTKGDESFISTMQEVVAYALGERNRIYFYGGKDGILYEARALLEESRALLVEEAQRVQRNYEKGRWLQ